MKRDEEDLQALQAENLRIQNEHLREQTLFYREQNEAARGRREMKERRHEEQEETLRLGREKLAGIQRGCTHRKGGKGDDLVRNTGSDPNYSVNRHRMEWGEEMVTCTRCRAEWWPGDTAENHPTGIAYADAMKFPTDNVPSGAAQFRVDPSVIAKLRAGRLAQRGFQADGKTPLGKSAAA